MTKSICNPFSIVSALFFDDSGDADDELDDGELSSTNSKCSTCSKGHRRVFCSSHTDSSLYTDYDSDITDEHTSSQNSEILNSEECSSSKSHSSVYESDESSAIQSFSDRSSSKIHSDSTMYCISELSFLAGDSDYDSHFVQQNWRDVEWQNAVNEFLDNEERALSKSTEVLAKEKISNNSKGSKFMKWKA